MPSDLFIGQVAYRTARGKLVATEGPRANQWFRLALAKNVIDA